MSQAASLRRSLEVKLPSTEPKPAKTRASIPPKNLRDDFAIASLDYGTTIYAKMTVTELDRLMGRKNYTKDEAVARLAYNMADAMLAAREK